MRTANICPTCATYINAVCVIYDGPAVLTNIPASPDDNMDEILVALNETLGDIDTDITDIQNDIITINNTLANQDLQEVLTIGNTATLPIILTGQTFSYSGAVTENLLIGTTVTSLAGTDNLHVGRTGSNNTGDLGLFMDFNAGQNNEGDTVLAIGRAAASNNTGDILVAVGSNAGGSNKGDNVTAIGVGAALSNEGNSVTAVGFDAANGNTGDNVTAFGQGAAQGNQLSQSVVFSNLTLPTYADHTAAAAAITVIAGASIGCTYLYHNQATNSIGAVRL
jgi:hypothetical protein